MGALDHLGEKNLGVEQLGWSIAGKVLAEIVSPRLVEWLNRRHLLPGRVRFWFDKKKYLKDVPDRLKRMPFIYAGVDADVLNDFVEIDIDRLNPGTLIKKKRVGGYRVDYLDLLRDRRQVFIVGYAGIGKTTYQRHSVLQVLHQRAEFLHRSERLLPVYIPLKLVPNAGKTPILTYLIRSPPFNGDAKALLRAAQGDGLFLCLDGYDEIALTGTSDNYIQRELARLLFPGPHPGKRRATNMYAALASRSRIWLTSRPQFLQFHPVGVIGGRTDAISASVATVEILGIGSNRQSLVQRVFDRYSAAYEDARDLLNAEYFLQHLDQASDGEIREMSFSPLFLTVMCYNYAQRVLAEGKFNIEIEPTFELLILKCIDLLLEDIDAYKAREFSDAQRQAIVNRRNQFVDQKKAFLAYLAADSYVSVTNYFTEEGLRKVLFRFLSNEPGIEQAAQIRQSFVAADSDRPSFVRQLIYCGVFVLVDVAQDQEYFDFPHRRFKEVLAASYFSSAARYVEFLTQISHRDRSSLVELVSVLKRSAGIKESRLQQEALSLLLDRVLDKTQPGADHVKLTEAYLDMLPKGADVSSELDRFVHRCLEMRVPEFEVSSRLLQLYRIDIERAHLVEQHIREGCKRADDRNVAVGLSILGWYSPGRARQVLGELLQWPALSGAMACLLLWMLLKLDAEEFASQVRRNLALLRVPWLLFDLALDHGRNFQTERIQALWMPLPEQVRTYFLLYAARLLAKQQWEQLSAAVNVSWDYDLVLALREPYRHDENDGLYFVSSNAIERLGAALMHAQAVRVVAVSGDTEIKQPALALWSIVPSRERPSNVKDDDGTARRYACVEEIETRHHRWELENSFARNRFTSSLSDLHALVDKSVIRIFSKAQFSEGKELVAFAGSQVHTQRSLSALLRERATDLFSVSADECAGLAAAWQEVPAVGAPYPRYFV